MANKFNYTANAQKFFARFPILTYISIQVNFWIIANILLAVIIHLQSASISLSHNLPLPVSLNTAIIIAVTLGSLYGIILGFIDIYLDSKFYRRQSLGKIFIFKTTISLIVIGLFFGLVRFAFLQMNISTSFYVNSFENGFMYWKYPFFIVVIYYFFMNLVISFINNMNTQNAPGVLIPLLLGKYRNPREEERIFMFMDMKSSTTLAEKLGHLKYSALIRDSFMDINQALLPFRAEIYQYADDGIVLTWRASEGILNHYCIRFYFACKNQLLEKNSYYQEHYGFSPHFKAGIHIGKVTVVEIGDIKRDIAYHGDTINTAARIQSVCNEYNRDFLISRNLLDKIGESPRLQTEHLGMIQLKGKSQQIEIASLTWL